MIGLGSVMSLGRTFIGDGIEPHIAWWKTHRARVVLAAARVNLRRGVDPGKPRPGPTAKRTLADERVLKVVFDHFLPQMPPGTYFAAADLNVRLADGFQIVEPMVKDALDALVYDGYLRTFARGTAPRIVYERLVDTRPLLPAGWRYEHRPTHEGGSWMIVTDRRGKRGGAVWLSIDLDKRVIIESAAQTPHDEWGRALPTALTPRQMAQHEAATTGATLRERPTRDGRSTIYELEYPADDLAVLRKLADKDAVRR